MTIDRRLQRIATISLATLALGCSGSSDATGPGTNTNTGSTDTFGGSATATSVDVTMPAERYTPNKIDIARGGTVRFIFTSIAHDVRFNGAASAPADILTVSNTTASRTFATAGIFPFLCTLHAGMTGTVTVH